MRFLPFAITNMLWF